MLFDTNSGEGTRSFLDLFEGNLKAGEISQKLGPVNSYVTWADEVTGSPRRCYLGVF